MKIRFWGTRGSIPAPAHNTVEFGGNTSCVEIILKGGDSIILDAGTGIRPLGIDYLSRNGAPRTLHLMISHVHWDHIQGFPFFLPAYHPDFTIHIYSHLNMQKTLSYQMTPPFFPVTLDEMKSNKIFHTLNFGAKFKVAGATVRTHELNHPQKVSGYRIEEDGKAIIYSTDTEPAGGSHPGTLETFVKGADLMLFDAQYTPQEYIQGKVGWGHSTYSDALLLAKAAGVKKLVLYHHDPTHDDDFIRKLEEKAKGDFPDTVAAREGMIIEI
ncbi:MAG: MBL fold metallo-hydrolase [bacterium]